jgi:flagellar protein FlgJ
VAHRDIYTIAVYKYQKAYISSLFPVANRVCEKYDVEPISLLALAAIETDWGKLLIPDTNNHFMLLADSVWPGEFVTVPVEHLYAGMVVQRQFSFKKYYSVEDCFLDLLGTLKSETKLYMAFINNKNPRVFLSKLRKAKFIVAHPDDITKWEARDHTRTLARVEKIVYWLKKTA